MNRSRLAIPFAILLGGCAPNRAQPAPSGPTPALARLEQLARSRLAQRTANPCANLELMPTWAEPAKPPVPMPRVDTASVTGMIPMPNPCLRTGNR